MKATGSAAGWLGLAAGGGDRVRRCCRANALMSGRALPTFLEVIGPREGRTLSFPTMILGFALIVTTLIAAETALGLRVRPALARFPVRQPDHGRGAVLDTGVAQPSDSQARARSPRPCSQACSPLPRSMSSSTKASTTGSRCGPVRRISCSAVTLWRARSAGVAETTSGIPVGISEAGLSQRESGDADTGSTPSVMRAKTSLLLYSVFQRPPDEISLISKGNGSELPLPLWNPRVGGEGSRPNDRSQPLTRIASSDAIRPLHKGRGEVSTRRDRVQSKAPSNLTPRDGRRPRCGCRRDR